MDVPLTVATTTSSCLFVETGGGGGTVEPEPLDGGLGDDDGGARGGVIGGVGPPGPCNWGLLIYADWMWNYGEGALLPSGDSNFSSGFSGNYWSGGYSSAAADKLIDNERFNSGIANVYKFENYISRQVAALWFPTVSTWSVVQDNLVGWYPQNAFGYAVPSEWHFKT